MRAKKRGGSKELQSVCGINQKRVGRGRATDKEGANINETEELGLKVDTLDVVTAESYQNLSRSSTFQTLLYNFLIGWLFPVGGPLKMMVVHVAMMEATEAVEVDMEARPAMTRVGNTDTRQIVVGSRQLQRNRTGPNLCLVMKGWRSEYNFTKFLHCTCDRIHLTLLSWPGNFLDLVTVVSTSRTMRTSLSMQLEMTCPIRSMISRRVM